MSLARFWARLLLIESPGAAFLLAWMIGFALATVCFGLGRASGGGLGWLEPVGWLCVLGPFVFGALMRVVATAKRRRAGSE